MKYLQNIILFLLTRVNLTYKSFGCFYDSLEDETIDIIESKNYNYLTGLLNYSYGGCLDYPEAEQFLEEHQLTVDDYLDDTQNYDLSILLLCDYLGY